MAIVGKLFTDFLLANTLRSDKAHQVIQLFEEQFGVSHVDVQYQQRINFIACNSFEKNAYNFRNAGYYIIVKIDKETVTNELGQHIQIYDLFIKIPISESGALLSKPSYIRSTFTKNQFRAGYVHSHCMVLDKHNLDAWRSICVGTGPILDTIKELERGVPDINRWMGMIAELRQIVRVESLNGGPYIRLASVSDFVEEKKVFTRKITGTSVYLKSFLKSYIRSKRLKLGYVDGEYCLGCTFAEWLVDFTKYYEAYKQTVNQNFVISTENVYIKNNKIYVETGTAPLNIDFSRFVDSPILAFKGEVVKLKFVDSVDDVQKIKLINPDNAATILKRILDILNKKSN